MQTRSLMEYGPANYTILIKIALFAETGSARQPSSCLAELLSNCEQTRGRRRLYTLFMRGTVSTKQTAFESRNSPNWLWIIH